MIVKTLGRCFNERIDRERGNTVDTVEDRIQKAVLTAIDSTVTLKSKDAISVMANSERGEHIRITAPFENVCERNFTLYAFNTNDETRNNILDEVSELSFPGKHFDRQPHTNHYWIL